MFSDTVQGAVPTQIQFEASNKKACATYNWTCVYLDSHVRTIQPAADSLEAEKLTGGVQLRRGGVANRPAQIREVFLIPGALFELGTFPFVGELLRGEIRHGWNSLLGERSL
jgi:hypothetical protein